MNLLFHRLACRLVLMALCLPVFALAAGEREKARLESVREQRAAVERQLKESESARAATADQLRDTEKAISVVGRKLHALKVEREGVRQELAARESEYRRLDGQTVARQAQLARLLRHQFHPREADALSVLLSGGDPNASARDRHFLALLSRAKADLIAGLRRDAAETRRLAAAVQRQEEKLAELSRREEQERATLRQRQQERQATLAKVSRQIRQQRREIDSLKKNEQRLANLVASLVKRIAKPKAPGRTVRGKPSALPDPESLAKAQGAFANLRGRLPRPVAGAVTGRYGARRDDGESVWKGLFIRADEGTEVRAVAPGRVVFADWLRGYGNLLIIDHDDDFLSVYGNNQSLLTDVGQKVGAGATVATVGTGAGGVGGGGGGQPESGLYFELRYQGRAFDPGKWLMAR
ncbi:MAG: peptidoglycan DD-metalloendopeptidase family protein [Rhodocyclaceae bacterium]|nr:peptidoglycan DD-metalloendopeptidase family protein [Rhodocyclaceae bacterium]